jgi:hypothetical protein
MATTTTQGEEKKGIQLKDDGVGIAAALDARTHVLSVYIAGERRQEVRYVQASSIMDPVGDALWIMEAPVTEAGRVDHDENGVKCLLFTVQLRQSSALLVAELFLRALGADMKWISTCWFFFPRACTQPQRYAFPAPHGWCPVTLCAFSLADRRDTEGEDEEGEEDDEATETENKDSIDATDDELAYMDGILYDPPTKGVPLPPALLDSGLSYDAMRGEIPKDLVNDICNSYKPLSPMSPLPLPDIWMNRELESFLL